MMTVLMTCSEDLGGYQKYSHIYIYIYNMWGYKQVQSYRLRMSPLSTLAGLYLGDRYSQNWVHKYHEPPSSFKCASGLDLGCGSKAKPISSSLELKQHTL